MRKGVADLLVGELARLQHVTVVQRERLEEVVREQALQLSGRVDEASAVRVGRLTGATVLLTGSIALVGKTLRLDVQLIGVEHGVVLDTASAEGPTTDPLAVAKSLTAAVLARMHTTPGHRFAEPAVPKGFAEAAGANDAGETLARAGKLFQALEEYEKSMGAHAGYGPARSNYSATVRALSGRDLTKDFQIEGVRDRRRVAARLVDRLATGGLTAELGRLKVDTGDEGLVATVPVVLSADPAAIEAVSEMTTRMGGRVERRTVPAERVILDFTQATVVGREVTRQLAVPRRAFVRLLGADGRPIAVVSGLREWQLSKWAMAVDEIHVFIEQGRRVEVEAKIGGLTEEEAGRIARAEVVVEPVVQERALVRVEYAEEMDAPSGERQSHVYRPGSKSEPIPPKRAKPEEHGPKPGELLQKIIGDLWNPSITAHGPGSKVLPGNLRTATVGLTIEENGNVIAPPRLVKSSGESLFDDAALDAVVAAIPQWLRARQVVGPVAGSPRFVDRPGRLRVSFQLVKDMPSVNVITVLGASRSVSREPQPLSSIPAPDSPR
jgi:TolB-like protein